MFTNLRFGRFPLSRLISMPGLRASAAGGLLALSLCLSACMTPYESGLSELSAGNLGAAETHAQQGLKEDPENPALNLLMAEVLSARQKYRDAEPYAARAFAAGSSRAEAGRVLGKIQWELGRPADAADSWLAARQADPAAVGDTDLERALTSAIAQTMAAQQFERALGFRQQLAQVNPQHPEAQSQPMRDNRERAALEFSRKGHFEQSVAAYRALLKDYPGDEEYTRTMAQLLARLDQVDAAIEAYDEYIAAAEPAYQTQRMIEVSERESTPEIAEHFLTQAYERLAAGEPSAQRNALDLRLAALRFDQNQIPQGRAHLDKYLEDVAAMRGTPLLADVFITAANVAISHQQPTQALELLERGLQEAPPNWALTTQLAGLYTRRARQSDMERALTTFVERSESATQARLLVGRWAAARRNFDLALAYLERAGEDDKQVGAQIALELAEIYMQLGRADRLKVVLSAYLKDSKRTVRELRDAATLLQKAQFFTDAEAALKRAINLEPTRLELVYPLALLYKEWNKPERILPFYDRWVAASGGYSEHYDRAGAQLLRLGETDHALTYFRKAAAGGHAESWLQLANISREQRRDAEMRHALEQYIAASDSTRNALRTAISYYQVAGMVADETAALTRLLHEEPPQGEAYRLRDFQRLAELLLQQEREDEAVALWVDVITNARDTRRALQEIGQWVQRSSDPAWVLRVYEQLLERPNPNPMLYQLSGDAWLTMVHRGRTHSATQAHARRQARRFFMLYARHDTSGRSGKLSFAVEMSREQMWEVVAEVYRQLLQDQPANDPHWFDLGRAHLKLGNAEKAREFLGKFARARKDSPADAQRVGEAYFEGELYRDAEPYFEPLLTSQEPAQVDAAFRRLAEIYRATGRADQLPALITRYLQHAQNPTRARQEVLTTLQSAGLYAEAARQIERIRAAQGNVMGLQLAVNQFQAGQLDAARESFARYAAEDASPGDAWVTVGEFYLKHAQPDWALEALERATTVAPDSPQAQLAYGRALLYRGEVDAGQKALQRARLRAVPGERSTIDLQAALALERIGRFDLATQIAENSLHAGNLADQEYYIPLLTRYQLATQAPSQAQRTAEQFRKASIPLQAKVEVLMQNDFVTEIGSILEDEIAHGDNYTAMQILQNRPQLLTDLGGVERLENAVRPMVERSRDNALANAQLGHILVRQGELRRAIPYLRQAVELDFHEVLPVLAGAYANLGLTDQAHITYQRWMGRVAPDQLDTVLAEIGIAYELSGQREAFMQLLRTQSNQPRFAAHTRPLLTRLLAQSGQVQQAVELIQRLAADATSGSSEVAVAPAARASLDSVAACLEALAGEGYEVEAAALLAEVQAQRAPDSSGGGRLEQLALRLGLSPAPGGGAQAPVRTEGAGPQDTGTELDPDELLERARLLMIGGEFERAAQLAGDLLANTIPEVYQQAAELLLSNAMASQKEAGAAALGQSLIDRSTNLLATTKSVSARLSALGLDPEALKFWRAVVRAEPTRDNLRNTLNAAQAAGDQAAMGELVAQLSLVHDDPLVLFENMSNNWLERQSPALTRTVFDPVQRSIPASFNVRLIDILLDFRAADVTSARQKLVDLLEFVQFDPYAVQRVLAVLDQNSLFVESARVVVPQLAEREVSPLSQMYMGMALRHIGMKKEAEEHLTRYLAMTPQPVAAATEVAARMMVAGFNEDAVTWANRAIDAAPQQQRAYYYRGAARLRMGQGKEARDDLARSIGVGIPSTYGLYHAALYALQTAQDDIALELIDQLLASAPTNRADANLTLALNVFGEAKRSDLGLKYFEQHYPEVLAGTGLTAESVAPQVSTLFADAGQYAQSYRVYDSNIQRLLMRKSAGDAVQVYMNNLAYGYATTPNRNPEVLAHGFDLVHRAIAASTLRSTSYLDTLGWLYFQDGKLDPAERYVRAALSTTDPSSSQTGELLDHIIAIEKARGRHATANWLQIYRDTLE